MTAVLLFPREINPMSLDSVRAFFAEKAPDIAVIESEMSSATVALAAQAYGVEPARIAKTLSLRVGDRVVLIVASGTARMDNKKVKARFGGKPKMLDAGAVAEITGHEVGGVCPFGLKTPLRCFATYRCKRSTRWCRRPARPTARCGSRRCGWPNWWRRNGSMYAGSGWTHPRSPPPSLRGALATKQSSLPASHWIASLRSQ